MKLLQNNFNEKCPVNVELYFNLKEKLKCIYLPTLSKQTL